MKTEKKSMDGVHTHGCAPPLPPVGRPFNWEPLGELQVILQENRTFTGLSLRRSVFLTTILELDINLLLRPLAYLGGDKRLCSPSQTTLQKNKKQAKINVTYIYLKVIVELRCNIHFWMKCRDVQEPESSKFFRSRIGLEVKFNVKTGVGVGAGVTISLSYYCNVH